MGVPGAARIGALLLLAGLSVGAPAAAQSANDATATAEAAILAEVNFARQNPQAYAAELLAEPVTTWEAALGPDPEADADAGAYAEAVAFLQRQAPLPPLRSDDRLARAALEHVALQGPSGEIGHGGTGGEPFDARLRRHGAQFRVAAENITYGPTLARDVVRELIIDRGVRDRGHRRNIFLSVVAQAGVSCGSHSVYGEMCVIDFIGGAPVEAPAQDSLRAD